MTNPAGVPPVPLDAFDPRELFPIREVARLTGINPITLRAWERRYGLIQPTRTESGHRLYSMADVERVRRIQLWTQRGVPVSKVGDLLARGRECDAEPLEPPAADPWESWRERVRRAVRGFDEAELEQVYGQLFGVWPLSQIFLDVLQPVWQELSLSVERVGGTSEWLFLDNFLRARLWQRLQLGRPSGAPQILLMPLPGQCRELELLVGALLLGSHRLAVCPLPMGQPLEELGLLCERRRPAALVFYSNLPAGPELTRKLGRLGLQVECPVALAGEAAELAEAEFAGSAIACLGRPGQTAHQRLVQFLGGRLDT